MRRLSAIACVALLLLTVLCGCGTGKDTDRERPATAAQLAANAAVTLSCRISPSASVQDAAGQDTAGQTGADRVGTALVYRVDGQTSFLVTGYHVIAGESETGELLIGTGISVTPSGFNRSFAAELAGYNPELDLAVLTVTDTEFAGAVSPAVPAEVSAQPLALGQTAYGVGNVGGLGLCVSVGCVSVLYEEISVTDLPAMGAVLLPEIRSDVRMTAGASGGGLFDADGCWIGLINACGNTVTEGYCYAIPAPVVAAAAFAIESSAAGGRVPQPDLGLTLADGEVPKAGITVAGIRTGSAASVALCEGDVILSVQADGRNFGTENAALLRAFLLTVTPGSTVTFTVERKGETVTGSVLLKDTHFSGGSTQTVIH